MVDRFVTVGDDFTLPLAVQTVLDTVIDARIAAAGGGAGGGAGATILTVATTVTASGAAVANKHNPVNAASGNLTITLPTGQPAGTTLVIEKSDSTTNTVTASGSIRGVGPSTLTLTLAKESIEFLADTFGSWWPIAGHKTLGSLDARFAAFGTGGAASDFGMVTVGMTGSGAMQICDGVADNVQIQAAVNTVATAGGGIVRIFSGLYDIQATIVVPKDPKIRIEGQYTTKSGYGGTTLQVNNGVGAPTLTAIVSESGTAPAITSNADLSHASQYDRLIFDGLGKATTGLLLLNTDHTIVSNCKFVGVTIGIDGQYSGTVSLSDYAGGLRVQSSSFLATSIGIQLNSHTQDWITDSWFLGAPSTCHIRFISCNKIHLSNNEFNTVSGSGGSIFIFDDTSTLFCGDINVTGGFMNAGTGKNFWTDNRTNVSGKGVIVSGVRMVTGVTTRLFGQAKVYQGVTYTSANKVGGFIVPDVNDEVILLNGASGTMPVQLPPAALALKNIWLKAISVTNAVTIVPAGVETIEQAGVFSTVFTFGEVNESVLLTPDSSKWRVLENHKPSNLSNLVTVENISNATTVGRTLLKAVDAPAARTALGVSLGPVGRTSGAYLAGIAPSDPGQLRCVIVRSTVTTDTSGFASFVMSNFLFANGVAYAQCEFLGAGFVQMQTSKLWCDMTRLVFQALDTAGSAIVSTSIDVLVLAIGW